jgi:copper resistance protein D
VNVPLVIARGVHLASTLLLAGTLTFRCLVAMPAFWGKPGAGIEEARFRIRLTLITWAALAVAVVSAAAWLVFLTSEIGGVSAADAISKGFARTVLTQTAFGDTWTLRAELASLLAVLLLVPRLNVALAFATDLICLVLAAALAGSLAWAGHAAATEGFDGTVHLASDALHLLAAGAWLGALWPLAILLGSAIRAGDPVSVAIAHQATRRFSILGIVSVATILATGVINTYETLGTLAFSLGTDYNRLLLTKIGLFLAMLVIAAINRQRLTPLLSDERDQARAMQQLRWNSLFETGLGLAILAIVAVLGRLPPHVHG